MHLFTLFHVPMALFAGKRAITADTALRLARFFGTDAQSWMNLQTHYDLIIAEQSLSDRLDREIQVHAEQCAA